MKSKISLLAISDIHIGCPRLNPYLLHEKFKKFVYPQITNEIDVFFICGDFFDTLLNLNSQAAFESMDIIRELKAICRSVNCDLRILRGTFTHDRNQPKHFINGEPENDQTVKLYDSLSIEFHEKTGLNILYIPDNLSCENIYDEIDKLIKSHGLEKVDVLVHHGYFKHMLPEALLSKGIPHGCLDADQISKYVRGCVLNGHVHISSIFKNIISIGSFDRLAHGEEEPKGFYRIDIESGVYRFSFIENKSASIFKTINLQSLENESAINYFHEQWKSLMITLKDNEPVRLRIISGDKGVIEGCSQIAKQEYTNVVIDQMSTIKRDNLIENVVVNLDELPKITPDNICSLLVPIAQKIDPSIAEQDITQILDTVKE